MNDILTTEKLLRIINNEIAQEELKKIVNSPVKQIQELSEGNVNQVFRIVKEDDTSFIVKYAPPFAYRYQHVAIANERNFFETSILKIFYKTSNHVPKIYGAILEKNMTFMEDLKDCQTMREALISGVIFPDFSQHIIEFFTGYLKNAYKDFVNNTAFSYKDGIPELQAITKAFVFENPFGKNYPENVVCSGDNLDWVQKNIFDNPQLQLNRKKLQDNYYNSTEALLHGDLHTGSFLVNPKETYIIDPEFSKLGPISFDLGMLLANLIMNNIVSEYHLRADTKKLEAFKRWINKTIETIWLETSRLFEANGKDVTKLKQETIGYCGIEIIRRIIGEAQIKDYLEIKDEHIRTRLERKSMQIAVNQLLDYGKSMEISYYLDQI